MELAYSWDIILWHLILKTFYECFLCARYKEANEEENSPLKIYLFVHLLVCV